MTATNVRDISVLQQAAAHVGVRLDNVRHLSGRRWAFVLRLGPEKLYQRVSHRGRRVAAVCWHGHAAFFRELFKRDPHIEVRSRWAAGAVHYTAENFERTYPETGNANIGSLMTPMAYRDACDYDSHPVNRGL
jgi:hypothetical protein